MTVPANLFAAEQELTDLAGFYAAQIPGRRIRSIREFGAAIDGATDDLEAWQDAFAWASAGPGRALYFPRGVSTVSQRLLAPDGLHLVGDGPNSSVIKCTATPPASDRQLRAPIWLGNFHVFAIGYRTNGSGDPFATSLDSYAASAAVGEGDTELILATPANAADFVVGEIAFLRSQEQAIQVISGFDLILPDDSSLVRVTSANATTGVVAFERPAGFASATAPLLCRIEDNAADPYGPIYFAQDVVIANMGFEGSCAVGSNSAAGYDCHYRDIGGDVEDIVRANSLAYCSVDGFYGLWREVMAEVKLGAHDTVLRNLRGTNPGTAALAGPVPIISVGENCRNIEILDFKVDAPNYDGSHVVALQPGTNVTVRGVARVPSLEANPVVLYSDAVKSLRNFSIDLAVVHRSAAVIYVQGTIGDADQLPQDGRVRVMSHSLSEESTQYAIAAFGGSGIAYSGHFAGSEGRGRIFWGEEAVGNVALDCLTPEPVVEGPGAAVNIARCVAPDASHGVVDFSVHGRTFFDDAAPASGSFAAGDRVINTAPAPGGYSGWVCTTAGSPGTWKGFGTIQS